MNHAGVSRSQTLFFALALAFAIAASVAVPAQSAPVTVDVPCAGQWSFNQATSVLSCVIPTGLVCNPSVSPSPSPLPGAQVTINAGCVGATTYSWTADAGNSGCPGVPAAQANSSSISLASAAATASTCTYNVDATDNPGSKTGSGSAGVKWGTPPALANCQFSPTPGGATAGISLPLTVVCQNGPPTNAATFTWSATPLSGTGTATFAQTSTTVGTNSVTLSAAGSWTINANVAAANGNGTGSAAASLTVDPPGTTAQACAGFDNTLTVPVAWPAVPSGTINAYTANGASHMGPNDAVVVEFTTPATLGVNKIGRMSWIEYGRDLNPRRRLVLSQNRCDFTTGMGSGSIKVGIGGSMFFSAGTNTYNYPALLVPNRKYYINIKNEGACNAAHCDLQLEFSPPL